MGDMLNIGNLEKNLNSRVWISGPDPLGGSRWTFVSFLKSEFLFDVGASYDSAFGATDAQKSASLKWNALADVAEKITDREIIPKVQLEHEFQSLETWVGTSKPEFSLDLLKVAIKEDDNVIRETNKLFGTVFPTKVDGVLRPPLSISAKTKENRSVLIKIGKWFTAPDQLITGVGVTYSKETLKSGLPVYALVALRFKPHKLITYEDLINRYFFQ